jgi:hypothetical protein
MRRCRDPESGTIIRLNSAIDDGGNADRVIRYLVLSQNFDVYHCLECPYMLNAMLPHMSPFLEAVVV